MPETPRRQPLHSLSYRRVSDVDTYASCSIPCGITLAINCKPFHAYKQVYITQKNRNSHSFPLPLQGRAPRFPSHHRRTGLPIPWIGPIPFPDTHHYISDQTHLLSVQFTFPIVLCPVSTNSMILFCIHVLRFSTRAS